MGKIRNSSKFWLENLEGREHSENLDVDGRNKVGLVDWIHLALDRVQ
jgi:hypothetical protein